MKTELAQLLADIAHSPLETQDELTDALLRFAFKTAFPLDASEQGREHLVLTPPPSPLHQETDDSGCPLIDTFDDEERYGEREEIVDPQTGFLDL